MSGCGPLCAVRAHLPCRLRAHSMEMGILDVDTWCVGGGSTLEFNVGGAARVRPPARPPRRGLHAVRDRRAEAVAQSRASIGGSWRHSQDSGVSFGEVAVPVRLAARFFFLGTSAARERKPVQQKACAGPPPSAADPCQGMEAESPLIARRHCTAISEELGWICDQAMKKCAHLLLTPSLPSPPVLIPQYEQPQ